MVYIVGTLAPNSTHFTKKLVEYVPGRVIFTPSPPKTGTHLRHPRKISALSIAQVNGLPDTADGSTQILVLYATELGDVSVSLKNIDWK